MNLVDLLLSTEGRINRMRFWIGMLILIFVSNLILAAAGPTQTGVMLAVLTAFALAYPYYAIMAKRFQDRNKPGLLALIGIVPYYTVNILYTFRILDPNTPTELSRILDVVIALIGLWILVELGCLKGTAGPNRYGPDPLGQAKADSVLS